LRVPTIAYWPERIAAGTTSDLPWGFWDFLPTAAEVAGVPAPEGIDGISILPTLLGRRGEQAGRECMYWEFNDEQSLRLGDRYIYRKHPSRPIEVYDAIDDPGQTHDLASAEPDVVRRAEELFAREHTPTPYMPEPGQGRDAWERELRERGIVLPDNVDG
jgi:arylsulfatase A-like enzyme